MKLTDSQRRVLEALSEDEWVAHWQVPLRVATYMTRFHPVPLQTVTLNALLRKGLVEVRVRNAGLTHEYRRTPAGTAALEGGDGR